MTTYELNEMLDEFLNRWPYVEIQNMSLEQYVGIEDKDTFCQWVETRTRKLGSIKGLTSIKFGIYKRKKPTAKPKNYRNDDKYSWLKGYGENRTEAYSNVKSDVLKIIKLSELGRFEQIDDIILPDLFKWKIAFLYSNERLIPIYKREVLDDIGLHFGMASDKLVKISNIQQVMMLNKPANLDVYEYMRQLFNTFSKVEEKETISDTISDSHRPRKKPKRKGTSIRNTKTYIRTMSRSDVVQQKHNKIQERLQKTLAKKYGKENVILEENFVDIKLTQPDYLGFYEVKSSSYASDCVKEALGQILLYTYHDEDRRKKRIYVVGQYPANDLDMGYIEFIKKNLKLEFEYIHVGIE